MGGKSDWGGTASEGPDITLRRKLTVAALEHLVGGAMNVSESSVSKHPWSTAFLLATLATPAGVVIAWLAPRPLDAIVALPLVLVDAWATSAGVTGTAAETPGSEAPILRVVLLVLGIGLTWLFYVLAARLVLWRLLDAGD